MIQNDSAPTLQNVSYVAVACAPSWTGDAVADFLQKIIKTMEKPVAYLKDGGTEPAKAVQLLEEQDCFSPSIDDIYSKRSNYLKVLYSIGKC